MMETYPKDLATWSFAQPLINIPMRTSVLAAFLVDMPFPRVMDSFYLMNIYRITFFILTAGHKMEINGDLVLLTPERIQAVHKLDNTDSKKALWPQMEKALTCNRKDLPLWFLNTLQHALIMDKAHFLYELKTDLGNRELMQVLLGGSKGAIELEKAETLLIGWASRTMYSMIGRTLAEMHRLCILAYERNGRKVCPQYFRDLYAIVEKTTTEILTTYDMGILRILAPYVGLDRWSNEFYPHYPPVATNDISVEQANSVRQLRKQISSRRAEYMEGVAKVTEIDNLVVADLVAPERACSPTWQEMFQLHQVLLYTPKQPENLQAMLDGIRNSVRAMTLDGVPEEDDDKPASKRPREKKAGN